MHALGIGSCPRVSGANACSVAGGGAARQAVVWRSQSGDLTICAELQRHSCALVISQQDTWDVIRGVTDVRICCTKSVGLEAAPKSLPTPSTRRPRRRGADPDSNSSYYLFGLDVYIDSAARAAGAQCLHRRCAWGGYACLRVLPIQTGEDPLPHPTAGLPPVEPRP